VLTEYSLLLGPSEVNHFSVSEIGVNDFGRNEVKEKSETLVERLGSRVEVRGDLSITKILVQTNI